MAVVHTRADDVILAQRNQPVPADRVRKVTVPKGVTENGRSLPVKLDVSDAGERELNALLKKAEDDTRKAWEPIMKIVRHRLGENAGKAPRPTKAKPDAAGHESDAAEETLADADLEALTAPDGFPSPTED